MYSVLLVEDEQIELETLRDYIDWKKLLVDKIYTAENGLKALECIIQHEPDIMITDIHMPLVKGTDLVKRVREEGYQIEVVFLTGYDDFDYVKTAFKIRAADYILKPFSIEEVERAILNIEKKIEERDVAMNSIEIATRQVVENICKNYNDYQADSEEMLIKIFKDKIDKPIYGALAIYGITSDELIYEIKRLPQVYHSFFINKTLIVILLEYICFSDIAKKIKGILDGRYSIGYMEQKISMIGMKQNVKVLIDYEETIFYLDKGSIVEVQKSQNNVFDKKEVDYEFESNIQKKLVKTITAGDYINMQVELDKLLSEYKKIRKKDSRRHVYNLYEKIREIEERDSQLKNWLNTDHEAIKEEILNVEYYSDLCEVAKQYIDKIMEFFKDKTESSNYRVVLDVKNFIEEHYAENFGIEEMSSSINFSPNYLRALFKENTGQTIWEYLTEYRLLKACDLLKNKRIRIKDVSKDVGYGNVSYFCSVFTKRYGVTPNEYRKTI